MAEAVGIVAATLQFASVGNTILSLILKLRGSEDKVRRLKSQVNQLLALIDAIKSRLPREASNTMSQQLELAVLDCAALGTQMVHLLENIAESPDDSVPAKKWKAIVGVMKEKHFEEICDHLERHKTFLNLYISNTNSILLEKLAEKLDEGESTRYDVEQEFLHHEIVQDELSTATAMAEISHNTRVGNSKNITQRLPRAPEISLTSENLAAIAGVIENAVNTRFLELQRNPNFQCPRQAVTRSGKCFSLPEECSDSLVAQVKLNSSTLNFGLAPDNITPPTSWKPHPDVEIMGYRGRAICNCRPRNRKINWVFGLASLYLRVKLVVHHESCNTQAGYRLLSLQIKAFNTAVFKSAISLDARCRFSLTQSITVQPVVDFRSSTAFRLFLNDFNVYSPTHMGFSRIDDETEYEAKVTRIQNRLLVLIREGKVSPLETNQYGETLMSAALDFLELPARAISRHNPDIAKNLIRFLVALGVPLTKQSQGGISPLSQIALLEQRLQHQKNSISLTSEYSTIWAEMDDPHDDPFFSWIRESLPSPVWYCDFLQSLSEISEESTYNKILAAISSRSAPRLRKLLENGANINEKSLWGQTALHLSAAWPEGLSILIQGIGHVDCFDNGGQTPIYFAAGARCLEAVELLLQENCALFIRGGHGFVHFVLWDFLDTSEHIRSRIVSDLERRLSRLRNLDVRHLNAKEFETLSHQTFGPCSLEILMSLGFGRVDVGTNLTLETQEEYCGFAGHASLFYGGLPYLRPHSFQHIEIKYQGYDVEKRALSIFDEMDSVGFTSLDGYDNNGHTLLLIFCLDGKLNGIQWLLQKLQAPPNRIRDGGMNAMHFIAEYLGQNFRYCDWNHGQIEQTLCQLRLRGVDPLAKCCSMCACLIDGNSPTATLTREICRSQKRGIQRRDLFKSLLQVWSAAIDGCAITSEEVYRQMVLSETFTRLGLTHTCSNRAYLKTLRFCTRYQKHYCYVEPRDQENIDDATEIQDEEAEIIQQLDYWMAQYEIERASFNGTVEQFFDVWWDRLPDHEPEFFLRSQDYEDIAWEVEIDSD